MLGERKASVTKKEIREGELRLYKRKTKESKGRDGHNIIVVEEEGAGEGEGG